MKGPVGIDPGRVSFSWIPEDGILQSAFRVEVSSGGRIIADSGPVSSRRTSYEPDIAMPVGEEISWSVTLWDENGVPGEKRSSSFETVIGKDRWTAAWIEPETERMPRYVKASDPLNRASYLRKKFDAVSPKHARLYITAHGVYDAWINGIHVDGYFMAPGSSQYDKRLQVQTYDVTDMIRDGENEILVSLGEGWWRGCLGWPMKRNTFGTRLGLLCQIEADGETVLRTDGTWKATQNGPLGENDMMQKEEYDANTVPGGWHGVVVTEDSLDNLIGSCLPVVPHEEFRARLITTPDGEKVLDFGQNFAGYVEFDIMAKGGEKIFLQCNEALDENGNFQMRHNMNPDVPYCTQKIEYTCRPGRNVYRQTKCFYGFQYVLVRTELPVTCEEFRARAVYSDMAQTGFFRCGNEKVNKLFDNCLWSMKSNFVDIPTDCPTREKSGFSGDLQVFSETAFYLMDCYPVVARWLMEEAATQFGSGCVKQIAPDTDYNEHDGSAGWCDAFEIVSYRIMKVFGETPLLKKLYPRIAKWMRFCIDRAADDHRMEKDSLPEELRPFYCDSGWHWGEWKEPGRDALSYFRENVETGHAEIATAYLSYGCRLVSEIAERLGEDEDARYFRHVSEMAKKAYRHVFVKDGIIDSDRQCRFVRPLFMGLLDGDENARAAETLSRLTARDGIGTGFLTTQELCNVLTDNGHAREAYDLLLSEKWPSWLFEVDHGANTVWESWSGVMNGVPDGSLNHYAYASVAGWMMSRAAGISVSDGKITVRPYTDGRLGFVDAEYMSPLGPIRSAWRYEDGRVRHDVTIPPNADAVIVLEDGTENPAGPGTHTLFRNF